MIINIPTIEIESEDAAPGQPSYIEVTVDYLDSGAFVNFRPGPTKKPIFSCGLEEISNLIDALEMIRRHSAS